jgi:hypothetical protein
MTILRERLDELYAQLEEMRRGGAPGPDGLARVGADLVELYRDRPALA